MIKLFSEEWAKDFMVAWNADTELVNGLQAEGFNSVIAYGFVGEDKPRMAVAVVNGKAVSADKFSGQSPNWDLRATADDWRRWMVDGFGLTNLGTAVAMKKLRFEAGDYRQMIRNPGLARPFLHHFEIMGKIKTEFRV